MSIRVLVCGGRDYTDEDKVFEVLDTVHQGEFISTILHGAAKGADTLANRWALINKVYIESYPADWSLGKKAGPIRNKQMLEDGEPDLVVAFPGGKGTANMVKLAQEAGVEVMEIKP